MLGNAGGAKGPDFWCAFEDGEVRVIGDGLTTPDKIRNLQRKLYCLAKTATCRGVVARHQQ
jgi:RNA-directed DNA polymerase